MSAGVAKPGGMTRFLRPLLSSWLAAVMRASISFVNPALACAAQGAPTHHVEPLDASTFQNQKQPLLDRGRRTPF
jgi:hypothetical protein